MCHFPGGSQAQPSPSLSERSARLSGGGSSGDEKVGRPFPLLESLEGKRHPSEGPLSSSNSPCLPTLPTGVDGCRRVSDSDFAVDNVRPETVVSRARWLGEALTRG